MLNKIARFVVTMLTVGFLSGVVTAQNGSPAGPPQEPCWKQAGISRAIMEQRHEIEREIHSQVDAVCQNSSLSLHEKQIQAGEIRRQGQQKIDSLMTPEQQSTLRACQQQRGNRSANEGRHPGAGPCGNMGAPQGPQGPANENAQQPPDPQK